MSHRCVLDKHVTLACGSDDAEGERVPRLPRKRLTCCMEISAVYAAVRPINVYLERIRQADRHTTGSPVSYQ